LLVTQDPSGNTTRARHEDDGFLCGAVPGQCPVTDSRFASLFDRSLALGRDPEATGATGPNPCRRPCETIVNEAGQNSDSKPKQQQEPLATTARPRVVQHFEYATAFWTQLCSAGRRKCSRGCKRCNRLAAGRQHGGILSRSIVRAVHG